MLQLYIFPFGYLDAKHTTRNLQCAVDNFRVAQWGLLTKPSRHPVLICVSDDPLADPRAIFRRGRLRSKSPTIHIPYWVRAGLVASPEVIDMLSYF